MRYTEVGKLRPIAFLAAAVAGIFVIAVAGCAGRLDSRCRVDAGRHNSKIAKSVASSRLWDLYFEKMTDTSPLVELKVDVERRTKRGASGGDYDPGTVTVSFEARSLRHGETLVEEEGVFDIDMFLIGRFPKDATREEIQEIAFVDAEKESYPYLDRWIQIAAIKAMGLEGRTGSRFVPDLKKMVDDKWTSQDLRAESRKALARIDG